MSLLVVAPPAVAPRAHAHNDYEHARPLLDALDQGFRSVEADVWLRPEGLLVGHVPWALKPGRTLQSLYLDPLRARVKAGGGAVHPGGPPFFLLIDVKTDAAKTWAELARVLDDYADLLTVHQGGKLERKAVTVVVSGNCDRKAIADRAVRRAAVDGRPPDLDGDAPADLVPWVSASWSSLFKWDGAGEMPEAERARLKQLVARAHAQKRMVRFWGAPDVPAVWREQVAADVDLVNTDKLADLRAFLLKDGR